ncbi:hypothetical protein RSAG8_01061, partial [Rhizoctonia solani AG-8 WAC10335]
MTQPIDEQLVTLSGHNSRNGRSARRSTPTARACTTVVHEPLGGVTKPIGVPDQCHDIIVRERLSTRRSKSLT